MKQFLMIAALGLVPLQGALAETVKSNTFEGEIQRRALAPLADGSAMAQIYVDVRLTAGGAPAKAQLGAAGRFAAKAGCRQGTAMHTIVAGVSDTAAQFEVLCKGGR